VYELPSEYTGEIVYGPFATVNEETFVNIKDQESEVLVTLELDTLPIGNGDVPLEGNITVLVNPSTFISVNEGEYNDGDADDANVYANE
jgi:hypothetical protein